MADSDHDLLRPDLWELLLPAIKAARKAGRDYAGSGRYVPRQALTEYKQNDAGWPQTTSDRAFAPKSDLLDWGNLFGSREGVGTTILISDVPGLAESVREISRRAMEDDGLLCGVSLLAPHLDAEDTNKRREQVEFETLRMLIGRILNRADAVEAETDAELRSIYQQIERARFSKTLTGDVIVPLVAASFDADEPFHIDGNAWIEPLTKADHRVRALSWIQQDVSPYVAAAATHAVVLRDVQFTNQVHTLSIGREWPPEISADLAHAVAEAVYIVTEIPTGFAQILVRPRDWADDWEQDLPPLWSAWTGRAYPEDLNDREWAKARTPIPATEIDEIVRIAKALKTADKKVAIAARRCRRTSFRDDLEDVILDIAIGIEALVGKETDALTHRMAQRAAIALADDLPPANTYSLLKQFYGIRSKIAHGDSPKKWTVKLGENEFSAIWTGRYLLRSLLRSLLLADKPWDASSLDERMLERLGRPEGYPIADSEEE
ncbi:hypothetical protein [Rhodococcus koreensis]